VPAVVIRLGDLVEQHRRHLSTAVSAPAAAGWWEPLPDRCE